MLQRIFLTLTLVGAFVFPFYAQAPNGVVYIESNIGHVEGQNSILAFRRNDTGQLTQFGAYPTGGTGVHPITVTLQTLPQTLGPYDSDQNVILNLAGTRLFAVNSGSDTIAVFDVNSDGSLKAVKGSPFASGGRNPVSVGLAADESILVVVNKDYDLARPGFTVADRAPNYTSFRIAPTGLLIPVPFSTVSAGGGGTIGPGNPTPSQALVSPDGRHVFDTDTFGTEMESLRVDITGRLTHVQSLGTPMSEWVPFPLIPNPAMRPFVLGAAAHPTERIVYAGFIVESKAGIYSYDRSGNLAFVRSVDAGFGICWIIVNKEGTRVYTSNTLSNTIAVIDTTNPRNPVKIQEWALAGPPSGSEQMALDASGEFLYVVGQKTLDIMPPDANELHVLRIGSDGRIAAQTDRVVIPVVPSLPQGVAAK